MIELPDQLLDRLAPCPWTGCWFFEGSWESGNGYSKVKWQGETWMVHRLTWTLLRGAICPTFVLDHKCRVRACCNIDHLDPVPSVINTHRGEARLFAPARVSCHNDLWPNVDDPRKIALRASP